MRRNQNGASCTAGSGFGACAGDFSATRVRPCTEFARTFQKIANFAALAFFAWRFLRSYFELTSCPSTRT
jgi:hypothetical protein